MGLIDREVMAATWNEDLSGSKEDLLIGRYDFILTLEQLKLLRHVMTDVCLKGREKNLHWFEVPAMRGASLEMTSQHTESSVS